MPGDAPTPTPIPAPAPSPAPKPKRTRSAVNQAWVAELTLASQLCDAASKPEYAPPDGGGRD